MLLQRMFSCFSKSSSRASEVPEGLWIRSSSEFPDQGGEIPEDLVIEILLRVPAEFVTKFRSLSRSHRHLIDSPDFRQKHSDQSIQRRSCSHIILISNNLTVNNLPHKVMAMQLDSTNSAAADMKLGRLINSALKGRNYFIMDSCLGIMCLNSSPDSHILLWNPFTGSFSLPIKYDITPPRPYVTFYLGHDAATDDLKVLKICYDEVFSNHPEQYDCEIYSSKNTGSPSWKRICGDANDYRPDYFNIRSSGVFVEGTNSVHLALHEVIAFNFCSEKFVRVPAPAEIFRPRPGITHGRHQEWGLSCLDGCLCVYTTGLYYIYMSMSVWVMTEYGVGESWTMLYFLDNVVYRSVAPLQYMKDDCQPLLLVAKFDDGFQQKSAHQYSVVQYDIKKKKHVENEMVSSVDLMSEQPPIQFQYAPSLRLV